MMKTVSHRAAFLLFRSTLYKLDADLKMELDIMY